MTITNLYSRYIYYADSPTPLPIVCLIHGYGTYGADDFALEDLLRIAKLGFFVVMPGLRGWNSASGSKDASGREIWDIYDSIEYVKTNYASIVNPDNVSIVGYSRGGSSVLSFASKFPDYASVIVDHFGIADWGYNATYGWYQTGDAQAKSFCVGELGGTPVQKPNYYRARNTVEAIHNFTGGYLYLFHNPSDITVVSAQSEAVASAMDVAGLTNYTANYSTAWTHGYPVQAGTLKGTEDVWKVPILAGTYPAWTIPVSGALTVIGYVKTKRFAIWLNTNGTAIKGIDAVATVVYDTTTDTYTVTPLTTGGIDVEITQGAKTGSATNINTETEIVVT